MRLVLAIAFAIWPLQLAAETVVAKKTLRARTVVTADDIMVIKDDIADSISDPTAIIGQETRIVLYEGRPIREQDIVPPARVERNALVELTYRSGALTITSDGRSLDRGAAGDLIRIMNLASRATVIGRVQVDGSVVVTPRTKVTPSQGRTK